MGSCKPERTELANNGSERNKNSGTKTKILVVCCHPTVRQELMKLLNQKSDLWICVGAENANQASQVIEKRQVDLAVVDVSPGSESSVQLIERIRLHCPSLPILMLSRRDGSHGANRTAGVRRPGSILSPEATEQIVKAIRYVRSLLRSQILGFTVLVKVERSG